MVQKQIQEYAGPSIFKNSKNQNFNKLIIK